MAAVLAAVFDISAVADADHETVVVELWRLLGLVVFAGLLLVLSIRPQGNRLLWLLVIGDQAALAVAGCILPATQASDVTGAGDLLVWDGGLAVLLMVAFWCCRGWRRAYDSRRAAEPAWRGDPEVTEQLRDREPIFHHAQTGAGRDVFDAMTTIGYWEVGASGRVYDRESVIGVLVDRYADQHDDLWAIKDFGVRMLAEGVYLATYELDQDGRFSRRATIWRRTGSDWVAEYHQGTLI